MKVKMNQRMMKMVSPQRRKLPNLKKIAAMKQHSSIPIMKSQPIIHFLTPLYEIEWFEQVSQINIFHDKNNSY